MAVRRRRGDAGRVALTVVVVDDDPSFRRVARRLLHRRGLLVVAEAGDSAAAIAAVRQHRPDGVLMDVNLADEQGLVVTQAVTALVCHPVVVVTSTDNVALSHAELTACGARAFVSKDRLAAADLQLLFSRPDT